MDRPQGQGELTINLEVSTDLASRELPGHIEYGNEFGAVSYSRTIAIGAERARRELATQLTATGIQITVPETFVQQVSWPLLIDPVITTVDVPADAFLDAVDPDVAWAESAGTYAVVWEREFSSSDTDLFSELVDGATGELIPDTLRIIDVSDVDWGNAPVAHSGATNDFLFAAERGVEGQTAVWGRVRSSDSDFSRPQFQISGLFEPLPRDKRDFLRNACMKVGSGRTDLQETAGQAVDLRNP